MPCNNNIISCKRQSILAHLVTATWNKYRTRIWTTDLLYPNPLNAQDSNSQRETYDFENFQSAQRKLFSKILTEKPRSASSTHLEDEDATEFFPPICSEADLRVELQELWVHPGLLLWQAVSTERRMYQG
jgi:hypothetical protein